MKAIFKVIFVLALLATFSTLFFIPIGNQESGSIEKTKVVTTIFPA